MKKTAMGFFTCLLFMVILDWTYVYSELPPTTNELVIQGPSAGTDIVTYSPDGQFIATASGRVINIWQVADRKLLRTIRTSLSIESLSFNPKTSVLFVGVAKWAEGFPDDGNIEMWNISNGRLIKTYRAYANSIGFCQDGTQVIERGFSEINIRRISDQKIVRTINARQQGANYTAFTGNLALSADETLIASGKDVIGPHDPKNGAKPKYLIDIWHLPTGKLLKELEGHKDTVTYLVFPSVKNSLISCGKDKSVKVWNIQAGKTMSTFQDDAIVPSSSTSYLPKLGSATFSRSKNLLAIGNEDKNIRLWDITNGQMVNSFGSAEQISGLSFSPDGNHLAFGAPLKILSLVNGRLQGTVGSIDISGIDPLSGRIRSGDIQRLFYSSGIIDKVFFSSDNKRLISSSWNGVSRFWDISVGILLNTYGANNAPTKVELTQTVVETSRGSEYDGFFSVSEKPTNEDYYKCNFAPSPAFHLERNVFIVNDVSRIGKVNCFRASDGKLIRTLEHNLSVPSSLFVSSDNNILVSSTQRILSPLSNSPKAILWSMSEWTPLKSFSEELKNCLSAASDGKHLICLYRDNTVKLWRISDGKLDREISSTRRSDCQNSRLALSHDGTVLAIGSNTNSGDINIDVVQIGEGKHLRKIKISDTNINILYSIVFSPNNELIAVRGLIPAGNEPNRLHLVRLADGQLLETFHECRTDPIFTPDGKHFVSRFKGSLIKGKGSFRLHWEGGPSAGERPAVDRNEMNIRVIRISDGTPIQTIPGSGDVALSSDGKFMALRNHDLKTDELWVWRPVNGKEGFEQVLIMKYLENGEFITLTPDGYYNRSPEGTSQIYWTFNNGLFPESFSFEQFETVFRRPDIIKARLSGDLDAGKPAPAVFRPPYIAMADHQEIKETNEMTFPLGLSTSALDEVKTLRVFVNGRPTLEATVNAKEKGLSLDVPLSYGSNKITAIAYNGKGFSSNPKYVDVICNRTDLPKPDLYALGIGVSKYPRLPQEWQLSYAHTDAKAMVEAFKQQEGKLFEHVNTKLLTNEGASVEKISEVLQSLEGMSENDIALIFLAGHGIMAKDDTFYYLTSDGSLDDVEKGGLSWKVLGEHLGKIKGRVIMLLDACHSGNISTETVVPNDELAQKLRSEGRGGVMVFAASKGRQSALESPDLGGGFGAFAYTVTQALGPKAKEADLNGNGFVEFMELVDYVSRSVDKETEGEQTPWLSRKELFGDLAIAKVQ